MLLQYPPVNIVNPIPITSFIITSFIFRDLSDRSPTSLIKDHFLELLYDHPNPQWCKDEVTPVVSQSGCAIGCSMPKVPQICPSMKLDHISTSCIVENIKNSLAEGWTCGPWHISDPLRPPCIVSPFFARPKKNSPIQIATGHPKMRSIHNLKSSGVNSYINRDDYSPIYGTFTQALLNVARSGPNSYQCVLDIAHAYSNVCICQDDLF